MKKLTSILICLLPLGTIDVTPKETWHLKKQESGISVYTRQVENSKFRELKSVFQIKTSLTSVIALLNDFESYPYWVYRCEKSYAAKKISDHEFIHYQTMKAQWPIDNRDIVGFVKIMQDPITKVITQKAISMPDYLPKVNGYVRMILYKSLWTITPLKHGIVNIEYQLSVDPRGGVPSWFVNLTMVDGPFNTELNMKEWLMKEKYQKAKLPFIKEPD